MNTEAERLRLIRMACWPFARPGGLELDDLMQEAWLVTQHAELKHVYRLAHHRAIDIWRHRNVRARAEQHYAESRSNLEATGACDSQLQTEQMVDAVELTAFERDLLYRRFYQGKSFRAIGRSLEMHHTTVKKLLTQIESRLRDRFGS